MSFTTISYLCGGVQKSRNVPGALSAREIERLQEYFQNSPERAQDMVNRIQRTPALNNISSPSSFAFSLSHTTSSSSTQSNLPSRNIPSSHTSSSLNPLPRPRTPRTTTPPPHPNTTRKFLAGPYAGLNPAEAQFLEDRGWRLTWSDEERADQTGCSPTDFSHEQVALLREIGWVDQEVEHALTGHEVEFLVGHGLFEKGGEGGGRTAARAARLVRTALRTGSVECGAPLPWENPFGAVGQERRGGTRDVVRRSPRPQGLVVPVSA